MRGIKLLFLAVFDEFKTLFLLHLLHSSDKARCSAQMQNRAYQKKRRMQRNIANLQGLDEGVKEKWGRANIIALGQLLLAILTLVVGLLLARVYYKQMQANLRQAVAAEQQFDVMTNQLNEMRMARETDERAWVLDYSVDAQFSESSNIPIVITVHFRNTGKTPAKLTDSWIGVGGDLSAIDRIHPTNENTVNMIIAPNGEFRLETSEARPQITEQQIQAIRNGATAYIYGDIWYDGIFGDTHTRSFCYKITRDFRNFRPAGIHSSTDEWSRPRRK